MVSVKRKKLHPIIRMEDVLNPSRSSTLGNVVRDIANHFTSLPAEDDSVEGVWYSIPVAMNRDCHFRTQARTFFADDAPM